MVGLFAPTCAEDVRMKIEERHVGEITVVTVSGEITIGKGGDVLLKDKVRSLLQQGRLKLLVDLGGVAYLDSAGLGELVQSYVTAKNKGGSLKLLRLTKRLNDLLTITKLTTVFESFDSEPEAIASFGPGV
jgi:anti-sigma B factor antagonist